MHDSTDFPVERACVTRLLRLLRTFRRLCSHATAPGTFASAPALVFAGIVLACLAAPGLGWASGFTITREVTTLDVRRTGHYTETGERTLRIDSPAGIDGREHWSLT